VPKRLGLKNIERCSGKPQKDDGPADPTILFEIK